MDMSFAVRTSEVPALRSIATALIGLTVSFTAAAQSASPQEPTGTVTGHVYCDDTNGPARLARVTLEPVKDVSDEVAREERRHPHPGQPDTTGPQAPTMPPFQTKSVQTGLDGSFVMKGVKPGVYYVIPEMPGYLSPLAGLSADEWDHPTGSVAERMVNVLQNVTVEADRTAVVNVGLERGAAVSFDDGSPAVGVHIKALREKSDGSWDTVRLGATQWMGASSQTDDQGRYRIAGLTGGQYVIEADLSLDDISVSGFMGEMRAVADRSRYSLSFFTGGYLRARADAAFALIKGESRTDEDLVIPLSKLHSISGTVVALQDGHPLAGIVQLLYGDDKKSLANTAADSASGEFRFAFVPEGHFILKVVARDPQATPVASEVPQADAEDMAQDPEYIRMFSKSSRAYGDLEQPIDVHGDMDGLVLSVPERTLTPAGQTGTSQ